MTQLIVLGMLEMRPMSGYDIQTTLQELDTERWSGVQVGSIYHALKKLEKDGYIMIDSIEQTGLRQKATYKITEPGKKYVKKLIIVSLTESSVNYPKSLYSAITFMDKVDKADVRTALLKQKKLLQQELEALDTGMKEKKKVFGENLPPIIESTFRNMYGIAKLQIEYVDEILEII